MAVLFQHQLLTRARVDLGMTQEDAARAVGVDVRTYRRYESGEVNEGGSFAVQRASRRRIVERLCRELGLEESELLQPLGAPPVVSASLPRSPHFVGRAAELERLRGWLGDANAPARVLAIVALGGAGKTSLLERALASAEPAPFVHSFYEQPSVDAALAAAASYLGQSGGEPLEDVLAGLQKSPTSVFVLDGLELVQADGEGERARGELSDRRLVRLLRAVVRGPAQGRVLITSRFPLADLAAFEGRELLTLALPPLNSAETRALLQAWGVRASSAALEAARAQTGGHALSLAVLGSYASELLGGELGVATELALDDAARDQPLARRLHAILDRYAAELAPLERRLLGCICVFPRGATLSALARSLQPGASSELELRAGLGRLVRRGLALHVGERYSAHPFIRAHFADNWAEAASLHEQERARLAAELSSQPAHQLAGENTLDTAEELFEHTLSSGDQEGAFRVAQRTLGGFSHLGLRLGEFERGLRLTRALGRVASRLPADAAWRVVYDRGLYAAALGDLDEAVRAYRALLERRDGGEADATTHRTLAYTLRLRGELELAHQHVERSLSIGRAEGSAGTLARGFALQGAIFTSQDRLDDAFAAFEQVRALRDTPTARRSIWQAEYLLARGDVERAFELTLANLEECRRRQWAGHVAHCHVVLGRAAVARGRHEDAEHALDAALDWCRRSREVELTLEAQLLELSLARVLGDEPRAAAVSGTLQDAAIAGGYASIRQRAASVAPL